MDGLCDPGSQTIYLNTGLARDRVAMVLLHEVLHACWDAAELEDHSSEEDVVTRMARALFVTLRDNPSLVCYLMD